jgi:heparosan-N-sulfate-glucuronate 5-epimerase
VSDDDRAPAAAGFIQGGRLFSLSAIPRAWRAAFSRGVSYEHIPPGRHIVPDEVHGYYMDFRAKTIAQTAAERLLPAALAQLGLGWCERGLEGDSRAEEEMERVYALLAPRGRAASDGVRWEHEIEVAKYGVEPPFSSALAQGQIASFFVRVARERADVELERLARGAIEPLLAQSTTDLVSLTANGPILEEIPSRPRSHILNGWISALWGLLDVAIAYDDARARAAYEANLDSLEAHLGAYDTGWWTKYSLYPFTLPDLAKPIYHVFQTDQMAVLARLTGRRVFGEAASRWRGYDTRVGRARVVAQKGRFVFRYSRGKIRTDGPPMFRVIE